MAASGLGSGIGLIEQQDHVAFLSRMEQLVERPLGFANVLAHHRRQAHGQRIGSTGPR
jgi:hypothetical protein